MDRDHNNTYRFFAGGEGDIEGQPSGFTCQKYPSAKGLLIATIDVFSVDGANRGYVPTVMYYDSRGRMIQKRERPPLGLIVEFIDYNFTGQPTRRMIRTAYPQMTELYTYTYDHAGRLTKTTHKLNDAATVTLAENIYDELGRLQSTKANNQDNLKTAYTYNIRSWTKTITNPLFEQALFYNESSNGNTPAYNGNISVMKWVYKNPNISINPNPSVYNFKYDPLSRLISANNFIEGDLKIRDNLSTNYEYDKHGNVLSLKRDNKAFLSNYIETDNLTLSYTGNQLKKVTDSTNASTGFIDYVNEDVEYTFNANGAMATDRNKGLNMTYDPYNSMPKKITVSNTNTNGNNTYTYTAMGQKLKVIYTWSDPLILTPLSGLTSFSLNLNLGSQISLGETKTVDYAANKIYEDGALKKILIDNGYIENGIYYFYVGDHLGNNRIVADAGGNVIQKTDYYPFGMPTSASTAVNAQPYKYNGKEYDMMNGLNQYDYHARQYDPAIIRFNTVDPLAEKYYSISPYVYCVNNPINAVDFRGDSVTITYRTGFLGLGGKQTLTYENGNLYNKDGTAYIGKVKGFLAKAIDGLNSLRSTDEGNSLVSELQDSKNVFDIQKGSKNEFKESSRSKAVGNLVVEGSSLGSGGIIKWNPNSTNGGLDITGSTERPSYMGLGHELAHASDANRGVLDFRESSGLAIAEWNAVYRENIIRGQGGIPARHYYSIDMSTGTPVGTGPNLFKNYLYRQLMKITMPTSH